MTGAVASLAALLLIQSQNNVPESREAYALTHAARNICRMDTQDATKRAAINELRISPLELCQCNIAETVFAVEGTRAGAVFSAYIERTAETEDGTFQSDEERLALDAFMQAYQRSNENCVSRLLPPA